MGEGHPPGLQIRTYCVDIVDGEVHGGFRGAFFQKQPYTGKVEEGKTGRIKRSDIFCTQRVTVERDSFGKIPGIDGNLMNTAEVHGSSLRHLPLRQARSIVPRMW